MLLAVGLTAGVPSTTAATAERALRERVEALRAGSAATTNGETIAAHRLVSEFYARRGFRPVWTRPEQRTALLATLARSIEHGLDPQDYHAQALARIDPESVDAELLATDAITRLAYQLRFGKANPRDLFPDWSFRRSLGGLDPVAVLESILAGDEVGFAVERLAPQLPIYRHLRAALARHRQIETAGGWLRQPSGPTLDPGTSGPRVALLRARLMASGDAAGPQAQSPELYDAELVAAVRRFQSRHGLAVDGKVGPRTLDALDVTVAQRIDQIRVNLERIRWVAQDLAGDHLIVDIAGYSAQLFEQGAVVWSSRAIVGRPYRRTPVFRSEMQSIVLSPTWHVPPTILRKDILPRVAEDREYSARNRMRVVDAGGRPVDLAGIDWSPEALGRFPYWIVQAAGPDNALGRLKFVLPNRYAVYLHDTPAKDLFERRERAFSSGCIRLDTPPALAVRLLDDPELWNAEALQAAIDSGVTRSIVLPRPVPVLVLYFTADESGTVQFRRDLYGRDSRVLSALAAPFRFAPVDRGRASRGSQSHRPVPAALTRPGMSR